MVSYHIEVMELDMSHVDINGLQVLGAYVIAIDKDGKLFGIEITEVSKTDIGVDLPTIHLFSAKDLVPTRIFPGPISIDLRVVGHQGKIVIKENVLIDKGKAIASDVTSIADRHLNLLTDGEGK